MDRFRRRQSQQYRSFVRQLYHDQPRQPARPIRQQQLANQRPARRQQHRQVSLPQMDQLVWSQAYNERRHGHPGSRRGASPPIPHQEVPDISNIWQRTISGLLALLVLVVFLGPRILHAIELRQFPQYTPDEPHEPDLEPGFWQRFAAVNRDLFAGVAASVAACTAWLSQRYQAAAHRIETWKDDPSSLWTRCALKYDHIRYHHFWYAAKYHLRHLTPINFVLCCVVMLLAVSLTRFIPDNPPPYEGNLPGWATAPRKEYGSNSHYKGPLVDMAPAHAIIEYCEPVQIESDTSETFPAAFKDENTSEHRVIVKDESVMEFCKACQQVHCCEFPLF